MRCPKVAFLGYPLWSVGAINYQIGKCLEDCDVYHLDWNNQSHVERARSGEFDTIVGDALIMRILSGSPAASKTVVPIFHQNVVELKGTSCFDIDLSDFVENFDLYAVSDKVAKSVKDRYGKDCVALDVGVNRDFFPIQEVKQVSTIAQVANTTKGEEYEDLKGFDVFDKICEKAGVKGIRLHGKSFMCGAYIYKDADVVVCTSKSESLPIVMFECAAMKIPFISTKVGVVTDFDSVKTFEDPDEAADFIEKLKDKTFRDGYVDAVYKELMLGRDWTDIVDKHYKSIIKPSSKKISILMPTRNRPKFVKEILDSCIETASDISSIEFVIYTDGDDKSNNDVFQEYKDKVSIRHISGPRIVLSEMWNRCYENASADIFMHCGDDIRFRTKGWDDIVLSNFDRYPDKIVFLFGNDGVWEPGSFGTHGFIHRNWAEAVGYFVPPYFSSDFNDTWLNDVARMIGRHEYIDIYTEHLHPTANKHEWDQTHRERLERHEKDDCNNIYWSKADERQKDAEKLKYVMK